ncbi:hypothetical protein X743_33425 [Mesorhizobium sp. LNHC252B00]|nr:hypothetical protein X743_33425 [Mesorhizobium sp. LNHC252B00]
MHLSTKMRDGFAKGLMELKQKGSNYRLDAIDPQLAL